MKKRITIVAAVAAVFGIAACGVANFLLGDRLVFKISECKPKTDTP